MPFAELIGNAALVGRLARMAASGRVPPSLLFIGPPGVGKLQAAKTLAQALNCQRQDGDACGVCPACLRIAKGEHADVRIVEPEGAGQKLRVEGVRQIVSEAPFRPFEGRRRVAILVDVDRMNPSAANTLLKTLEEPPPWAVLVLVTANEQALLPTILSRCQILRFSPLPSEEISALLVSRYDVPEERAVPLAALSGGSLSKALELEQEPLTDLRDAAFRLAELAATGGREQELVPWADTLSKENRLLLLLHLSLGILRDVASRAGGGDVVHSDREKDIDRLARTAPIVVWLSAYGLAEGALEDLRDRYLNKRITMSRLLTSLNQLAVR
jgi:DNA polymerase-3 subunit delta'